MIFYAAALLNALCAEKSINRVSFVEHLSSLWHNAQPSERGSSKKDLIVI
ncbi:MAG: hypothetical protein ACJA0C_000357 [Candidatus Endobugula sp.]|jgi:hypothetical protein